MKKYAYYRDGLLPSFVCRLTIDGDDLLAEAWDYKDKKWVLNADAWDTIRDDRGNWALDEDYVEAYIQKMIDSFPYLVKHNTIEKPDGAKRKKSQK